MTLPHGPTAKTCRMPRQGGMGIIIGIIVVEIKKALVDVDFRIISKPIVMIQINEKKRALWILLAVVKVVVVRRRRVRISIFISVRRNVCTEK